MYATPRAQVLMLCPSGPLMPSLHLITLNYNTIKELKRIANESIWRDSKEDPGLRAINLIDKPLILSYVITCLHVERKSGLEV